MGHRARGGVFIASGGTKSGGGSQSSRNSVSPTLAEDDVLVRSFISSIILPNLSLISAAALLVKVTARMLFWSIQ